MVKLTPFQKIKKRFDQQNIIIDTKIEKEGITEFKIPAPKKSRKRDHNDMPQLPSLCPIQED